jgi:hypothetical protein
MTYRFQIVWGDCRNLGTTRSFIHVKLGNVKYSILSSLEATGFVSLIPVVGRNLRHATHQAPLDDSYSARDLGHVHLLWVSCMFTMQLAHPRGYMCRL